MNCTYVHMALLAQLVAHCIYFPETQGGWVDYDAETQVHVVGSYCTCNKWASNLVAEWWLYCILIQYSWYEVDQRTHEK